MILNDCGIVLDDAKYFGLSGDNVQCDQRYYITNPLTTQFHVKYKKKKKKEFSPKLLVLMTMSSKDVFNIYVHKDYYPFVEKRHKNDDYVLWSDKTSAYYEGIVLDQLKEKSITIMPKLNNPSNMPQARPVKTV
ncbi:unnamed protein product [Rotaria sordida]|uniref:Transposase n=1 Tax=Rotaria sordida TaxID=392033 RepID=A0A815W9Z2_9BILA|nr:unnamed protein product [Rotaria sordida]